MFILSIMPLNLSLDSDGVTANTSNQVDVAEHRVMELEALYSSLMLKQYLGVEIQGIDNTDTAAVKQELDKVRNSELQLLGSTWERSDNNSEVRLDYIKRTQVVVDTRIKDLQALAKAITEGTTLPTRISGVDNTNIRAVNDELQRITNYKTELEGSKLFWTKIIANEKKSTELEEASQFWDGLVSSHMHEQKLDVAYDLWNNMVASKTDAQSVKDTVTNWQDMVGNLLQLAEQETTSHITDTQKLLDKLAEVNNAFANNTETQEMMTEIETLAQTITDNDLKTKVGSLISNWNQYTKDKNDSLSNNTDTTTTENGEPITNSSTETNHPDLLAERQELQNQLSNTTTLLSQRQENTIKEKDNIIASTLWSKVLQEQQQNYIEFQKILSSPDNAFKLSAKLDAWDSTIHDSNETSKLKTSLTSWSSFIENLKRDATSQSSIVLGKEIIDSLKITDKLVIASSDWIQKIQSGQENSNSNTTIANSSPVARSAPRPATNTPIYTGPDESTTEAIANAKRRISHLQTLTRAMKAGKNLGSIQSQIRDVKSLIDQMKGIKSFYKQTATKFRNKVDPLQPKMNELMAELQSLLSQEYVTALMNSVGESLGSSAFAEINELSAVVASYGLT